PEDHAALVQERDRFEHAMRDLVREGIADGSIAPCDPKLVVFTLLGAINWVPKWFKASGPWSAEQVSRSLTDLLDRMVSADPAPALPLDIAKAEGATKKGKKALAPPGRGLRRLSERKRT